jgi:hypothetical protein
VQLIEIGGKRRSYITKGFEVGIGDPAAVVGNSDVLKTTLLELYNYNRSICNETTRSVLECLIV